jgi:hypothetical protein
LRCLVSWVVAVRCNCCSSPLNFSPCVVRTITAIACSNAPVLWCCSRSSSDSVLVGWLLRCLNFLTMTISATIARFENRSNLFTPSPTASFAVLTLVARVSTSFVLRSHSRIGGRFHSFEGWCRYWVWRHTSLGQPGCTHFRHTSTDLVMIGFISTELCLRHIHRNTCFR